jgi:DNA-binding transcriptional MocR family regulator
MMGEVDLDRWGHLRFHGPMSATVGPASLSRVLGDAWRRPGGSAHALADALRSLVVDGRLAARTRIPSERALAPELGLSRGTVSRAYDRLRADGFLVSARGSGSWLTLPDGAPGRAGTMSPPPSAVPAWGTDLSIASLPGPEPLLGEAAARAAAALSRHAPSLGYTAAGLPELRDAVAARFTERGAPTNADQILITAGAQHALHLLLKLLCAPGDRVLVDAPAYPRTLSALRGARARPVAVPLAPSEWDVEAWERYLSAAVPRLAVVMPDFHNPTGLTMAAGDREALARACATAGVVAVCDETNAELRLDGPATPAPLAAHDPGGAVVTVGSMSKAAWGGLRIGWVRAAPRMIRELAAVRGDVDMSSPVLEQLVGLELLARWDEVVASRRALLEPRRAALLAALAEHAPAWSAPRPHGGLSVWARLPAPVATRLAVAAAREGLMITPGPSFSVDGTFERHLRLPYTAAPEVLDRAVAALAQLAAGLGAAAEPEEEPAAAV